MRLTLIAGLVLGSLGAACGGGSPGADAEPTLAPKDYLPLSPGRAWAYRVTDAAEADVGTLQVLVSDVLRDEPDFPGPVYVLSEADGSIPADQRADEPTLYTVMSDGSIFCVSCEGYWIGATLEVGISWRPWGEAEPAVARIVELGAVVETEAGLFEDCLIIELDEPDFRRRVELAYAREVGLVRARYWKVGGDSESAPFRQEMLIEYGLIIPPRFLRPLD